MGQRAFTPSEPVSISVFLDGEHEPFATYKPPAVVTIDTTKLSDGEHVLHVHAVDAVANVGIRSIRFIVANGPGITINGLREDSRVRGTVQVDVNAFGSNEPFDPVRAESHGPIPVWTWVMIVIVLAWAAWYGIEFFKVPEAFAKTPTYAATTALAAAYAAAPPAGAAPTPASGSNTQAVTKNVGGFDYTTLGEQVYSANCSSCHGASAAGVPGTFPPLANDPIVTGSSADDHVKIVLHGLSGKAIGGTKYAAQMPSFASQLSDAQIAAVVDHERTSWGNHALPLVTPDQVKRLR